MEVFFRFVVLLMAVSVVKVEMPRYLQAKYGNNFDNPSASAQPSGIKTKTKTSYTKTAASKSGSHSRGCSAPPPTPQNAGIRCSQYSGCRADCLPLHQFPNGATQLLITCVNGKWLIDGGIWQFTPSCQPICLPQCQNRGICTAPNQCQCPENFSGPYCQYENKPCMAYPVLPTNSRRACTDKTCTISCLHGYQFPDGSSVTSVSCKDGFWTPDKERWTSVPDCEAICEPPCLNGGNCLAFGHCQCPQEFRGPQCQYSIDNCDAHKLQFNGGYNCSGDQMGLSCSLYCPEGMSFEATPSPVYTCSYQEARFTPAPIPQCIFNKPQAGKFVESYYHYTKTNSSTYNVKNSVENGFPEVSYVPPGQRWNSQKYVEIPVYENFATQNPFVEPISFIEEKLPEPGTCVTWQGSHYKTFDGKMYSFLSKCAHVLVRDAVDNTFSVVVQNECTPTCSRTIRIFFNKKEYNLKRSAGIPILTNTKKRLPIPGQFPGLRVETSAHYILVYLDSVGSRIKWDSNEMVQVDIQESLWNRTEGLCGRMDGDPLNDVHSPTISNFAASWKVEDLGSDCGDVPKEEHPCMETVIEGSSSQQATVFCRKLMEQRFAACHLTIDPSLLLEACRWDYCSCKHPDPTVCACETLSVYVQSCIHKGVKQLENWRDEQTCPMQCTGGRVYKPCGSAQAVCGEATLQEQETCTEGCYCPLGTVLHEDRCITKDQCPCKLRTKSFPAGTQMPKECNTCTCSEGKWVCTQISCGARCAAIGDPHYITFDGKKFDFMGQCSYHLVKTPTFSIEAENVACAGSISLAMNLPTSLAGGLPSCTKTVTVKFAGQTIKLKQNHDVVVNGEDITTIPYNIANVTIRSVSSIFLQVELPNKVVVWWDGMTRAYIDVPANFAEKTKGLCGTFNSNQKDDFLTPEEDIEQSVIPFANKWKTSEKCNDIPDALKSHPCNANIQNQPTAEKHCGRIKSDLFTDCHWIVDPEPYYQDCLYDMCSCEHKVSKCLCPTVAAYAEECARQGVKISWRDSVHECGVHCPTGQTYQICGNSCTRTCNDIALRPDCRPQCVEGCNCPEGQTLDDAGNCVPIGECHCHFDGLKFHPGYKEIRPASKAPELCTCLNAAWSCRIATEEERKKFPKANDLKSLCAASENMEFTTCEPVEPVTCKNMHNLEFFSATVCHAGCKCKDGFVLDTTHRKCVRPKECPCHHGGRSYKENATVQNECNTCQCQNGKWTCSTRPCAGECSAWGDSHFKTFDGKHYDFEGQCDYTLAKGSSGLQSFEINIQNVPCGTLGTTCSKSITIKVKSGEKQDILTLTKDKKLPSFKLMKHLTVRQVGLFVIVEAADLGLVVNWDKGTRVYVKLDPRWKDKVKGLCGNYNDNEVDDFQTPSGGITEASALIFGDSWKLQAYCPEPTEITSTCEERPDRKVWALKQCGVLKSAVFARCHSEVPVDVYFEKCIFDACACDQGGDCECLCTALAAYAQECNNRGVPIKWRSQKLCPMQCDERCSNYSPCISTCPIETCDNFLTEISKTCQEDTCIEGCVPKPCPPGEMYLNSSFSECVPRNICKPICMEIDGVMYKEGDLVEEDECYSCHCSRGEKVCVGQPKCTTELPLTTPAMEQTVQCESGWTQWINQDRHKATKSIKSKIKMKSDVEPLPSSLVVNGLKGAKCTKDRMIDIECRSVKSKLSAKETGLDVECSLERGLVCKSSKYKHCEDFEIRVLCQCDVEAAACDPLKPHKEHPTNCNIFYHCEDGPQGPKFVEKTCGPSMYFNPVTMVCDWPYAVQEIKPECEPAVVPEAEIVTQNVQVAEGSRNLFSDCPVGSEKKCAIQCDHLCLYYDYIVKNKGLCQSGKKCETECVSVEKNTTCPDGMLWASDGTCVLAKDCLCVSHDGKPIKPGTVYRESDCRICQCIDNEYACDESACTLTTQRLEIAQNEKIRTSLTNFTMHGGVHLIPILSTVTPPEECNENSYIDLIETLPNVVFNASSVLSAAFKPQNARFDSHVDGQNGGSWVPQYSNNLQYLQIDLGQQEPIYGIKIKGSPMYEEYVTSFKVSYSIDDSDHFLPVLNKDKLPQIFRGSIDPSSTVKSIFDVPFEAQVVKIHPETWHNGIALKVELIGCGEPSTTTVLYELFTTSTKTELMCDEPMGLDDGSLSVRQISVSSEINNNHSRSNLRLSDENGWQPVTNSRTEFIQIDFLEARNLTGLETKGGLQGWVTAYTVKYSRDGSAWNPVLHTDSKTEKTFLGNFDSNSPQINHFDLPIHAQFLKIVPTKWYQNIQMRLEVHGCFEPYPTLPEQATTAIPPACNYCPDVSADPLELEACRCKMDKWWDGQNCVTRAECPCFVGHMSYAVGTPFKKEDCSECMCKMGGVSHCTQKQCEACENSLRKTVTSNCECTCEPCPEGTRLCPTSNICLNLTLWCNGVQDCPDDEEECARASLEIKPTVEPVKKCPEIQCPPGYTKKIKRQTPGRKYQSTMFNSGNTKRKTSNYGLKTSGVKTSYRKSPTKQKPKATVEVKVQNCTEYVCVSTKRPPSYIHSDKECPATSCPSGFVATFEQQDYLSKTCPEYTCTPLEAPDSVCKVTGRTFNTFDNTEYKYDICDHILARDVEKNDWEVSLKKVCTKQCHRDLVVHHQEHLLVLHPNLTAHFDGYPYSVEQTSKITFDDFSVSRIGNTLVFVSNQFGFWIIWEEDGNLKLGAARKLMDTVDGLCGYFNGRAEDDKRKPDGTAGRTTAEFGDSWGETKDCQIQTCPVHVQNKAWEICQVKQRALEPCNTVVNKDAFISRCVETTCECLQAAQNYTEEEKCRCHSLQDFVVECLSTNSSIDLSDWRVQLDCPVPCEAPLVYHDCYQRKCEPTCESLSDPKNSCPKLPVCFPGCYCPPGTVKKGSTCISPSSCRNCECNVLPHLQYVTYDNSNFTLNANCVYVMSRDAAKDNGHKFQVLVTNAPCKNNEENTCVGKITILYNGYKVHVFRDMLRNRLRLVVNGERIEDFSEITWAKVFETASKHIKMQIPEIQVDVSVYFPSLGTSVKASSQKYAGKLEGLCGNCDGNPLDDFRTPSGQINNDINEFALSWLYDKLPGQTKELCQNKQQDCVPLSKDQDPCQLILDYKTFGQCLRVLDPSLFLEWCNKDTCNNHPELACAAIEAYARDCASAGFCINWRTNICPPQDCPSDKIYNPCGTKCPKTCQDKERQCESLPVEGCFCPDGQVLRNQTCVLVKDCEVCDDEGHRPGDVWKKDKCTLCTCEGTKEKCESEFCSGSDKVCEQGYQVIKIPSKEDECCDKYACVPEPTSGPTCETPQPISCAQDQTMKLSTKPNGCQQFICECKPLEECDPVDTTDTTLEPGYVKTIDETGCCPVVKTICNKQHCPEPQPCPAFHTLKKEEGKCCPLHLCEPPKDKCIYEPEYTSAETGGERARTDIERQKLLKNANESWQDGPCRQCKCSKSSIGNYQASCTQTDCSALEISQDYLDYELVPEFVYDQCCPIVKRTACKDQDKVYQVGEKWTSGNDFCTIYECLNTTGVSKKTTVTNCETDCELGAKYVAASPDSKQCCGSCKTYACVVEGTVYEVGKEWTSGDFCTKYFCLSINGTMQVQSVKVNCPELPATYTDNFLVESTPVPGECCQTHKTVACKENSNVYKVGDVWPSADGDKCKKLTCVENKNELNKQEIVETCNTNCTKGWEYKASNESCCGECIKIACTVGEDLKKPGENWTSSDNCTTFTCEQIGSEFIVVSHEESCPDVGACPKANLYTKGCCKHCNISSVAQRQCAAESIPLERTLGLVQSHREDHGECENKKPIEGFTECMGICQSSTFFDSHKGSHESKCSCCKAIEYGSVEVELECEDGYVFKKKVAVPSDCSCGEQSCSAKPFTKNRKASFVKS